MNSTHLLYSAKNAFVAAVLIFALSIFTFFTFEPSVSRSQITSNFTVSQQITNEISFVATTSITGMVGSIAGLTGGYATGTNRTVVNTNNPLGYSMTLAFPTTTSGRAMQASSSAYINDYTPTTPGTADYNWVDNSAGQAAEFGYSVLASTSIEAQAFKNNGSACNQSGGTASLDHCWMNPTTTVTTIISSSAPSPSSTTTLKFKVAVPNNPSPALPATFYYATGTLTAFVNP